MKDRDSVGLSLVEKVLSNLKAKYLSIECYQDNGLIITSDRVDEFMTYYISPDRISIHYSQSLNSEHGFSRLVFDDGQIKSFSCLDKKSEIISSIKESACNSLMTVHFIPALLSPEVIGLANISSLDSAVLKDDQDYSGEACFVVEGDILELGNIELTISKETHFLKRLKTENIEVHYRKIDLSMPAHQAFEISQ